MFKITRKKDKFERDFGEFDVVRNGSMTHDKEELKKSIAENCAKLLKISKAMDKKYSKKFKNFMNEEDSNRMINMLDKTKKI